VSQTAVRTLFVVVDPPRCDLVPRIEQVLEPTHHQTLFSQPSVKTLYLSVLRRLSRLNMHQLDLPLHAPRQKMPAGQFRPVVAADRQGLPTLRHDPVQYSRHSPTGKTRIHFQGQTLPRISIHHAQHSDRPPALHRIVQEIQRPLLVRRSPRQQRLSLAHAMFPFLPPDHQPCLPIHPMHALVVHMLSRAAQQHMQPPIPKARFLPRQLHQPRSQRLIRAPALVATARYRHRHQAARTPLAEGILPAHLLDSRLQGYELQPFFRITDCRASLSRLRSATSFRSFVFSSRSCLASCAWLTSMPPYFAFQAYSVCLDTPTSRATSSTFRPASTCFSAPIICASVCLLFDILFSPSFRKNHT